MRCSILMYSENNNLAYTEHYFDHFTLDFIHGQVWGGGGGGGGMVSYAYGWCIKPIILINHPKI